MGQNTNFIKIKRTNFIKIKRLNNKGFTLIELLAVVVILAVVMGIATTQVLGAMNNSRKGSLQDSAKSVAQAFQTKYSEYLVLNGVDKVYSQEGISYDFTGPHKYYLGTPLEKELNLSAKTYMLNTGATATAAAASPTNSFVSFDGKSFIVCLIANKTGSYYVSTATTNTKATIHGTAYTFTSGSMWACSTGETSWTT